MERDAFLARVARARSKAWFPPVTEPEAGPFVPALPETDLIALFTERLEALTGVVHRGGDPVEIVSGIADAKATSEMMCWASEQLPVPGLVEALSARGIEPVESTVPPDPAGRLARQQGYVGSVLGLTGAEAGFAETGSIVLRSGPGRPRMASLIPSVHVALLPTDRLYRSLAHWSAEQVDTTAHASNLVFVTGPSRTGDIEMKLNLGVHGPGEIHVILL